MSTASIDTVITDAGFDLLRAAPGHKLVYTRAVCGSGHVEKTQLATLTEISDYVMDLSIVEFGPSESAATLRLQLDNSKAPKEFQLYQIGVLAKLLDGEEELVGETLVQVMQYEKPDIVRAVPHVSEFVVNVLMGQAETVEGTIDMAAYVSIRQFSSRTVNGKPLSADVTITGEDIKVSVSDQTTVEAALSNKAPAGYGLGTSASPISYGDILEVMRSLKTGWYSGMNVANAPTTVSGGAGWYIFEVVAMNISPEIYSICIATNPYTKTRYLGVLYANDWSGWTELLSAGTPKEYDLLLSDGISIYSSNSKTCYSKNGFGMVMVNFAVKKTDGTPFDVGQITVAKLPDGYVPDKRISGVCGHNLLRPSLVVVRSQSEGASAGNIVVYITESVSIIEGTIMFYVNS